VAVAIAFTVAVSDAGRGIARGDLRVRADDTAVASRARSQDGDGPIGARQDGAM